MKIDVLYEDNHLIAVFKSAGVLTQGDKTGDENLMDEVKKYLKEKYQKTGNVFLGLLHRLDRPVSGIILFAKTSKGASRLSEQFRNHSVVKIYHAVVLGKPLQSEGTLTNYLVKDEKNKKAIIVKDNEAKVAELDYEVVASNDKYSLLKVQLKTGRFHQIRAQLANTGCPLLGDLKYGAPFAFPESRIALCANFLSFETATTKEQINLSIPLPKEWEEYLRQA
ncbi:MAG: RluA family pseudouridine synthase [Patescibacteria group bacterium]